MLQEPGSTHAVCCCRAHWPIIHSGISGPREASRRGGKNRRRATLTSALRPDESKLQMGTILPPITVCCCKVIRHSAVSCTARAPAELGPSARAGAACVAAAAPGHAHAMHQAGAGQNLLIATYKQAEPCPLGAAPPSPAEQPGLEKTGEARGAAPRGAQESERVGQPPDDAPAASQFTPPCPAALLIALRPAVLCAGRRHCAPMRLPPFSAAG